jgi:hypothetical protein
MELNTNPSNPNTLLGTDSIDIINIESPLHEMSGVDGAFTSYVDQSLNEIVFVDASVENHENLIGGVASDAKIILLDSGRDGILQISQRLEEFEDVKAVHVVSHGSAGLIQLGSTELSQNNLSQYTDDLIGWGQSLNEDADLLFYGCNVGEGTEGQAFLNDVSILTGADVAGSDDLTGNVVYGGDDWLLEYSTGDIEAETLRGNSSFTEVLSTVNLSDDGKLTFDEGINIVNIVSLSVVDNNTNLLIKDKFNILTAGSNATQASFNQVKVDINAIKDIEFKLGFGKDSLSFDSEISFANGQLSSFIIEGEENTLPGLDLVLGDLFGDSVNFNHNLYLGGANLNVSAENITVKDGVTISTRQVASGENHLIANSTGDSGELYFTGINPINFTAALGNIQSVEKIDIGNNAQLLSHVEEDSSYAAADVWLNARYFSNADIDNLFPANPEDWLTKTAKITIGDNAALRGNNIVIKAQAEDKNFSELIGADSLLDNFVIGPLQDRLGEALALPVKVLYRRSDASVDVNTGASLVGLAGVSVEAVATTDSTGKAKGSYVSIGHANAGASAKVNVKTGVEITAGEAVKIGSEGNATASISTETKATNEVGGLSLAVDYATITSHAIVEQGVTITAGKTANVIALGNKETEAEAESKTSESGKVSFGFGINISDTDIRADVDGTIIANQNPGAIVKLELDPLKEVTYEFNPTETSVVNTTENTIDLSGVAHSLRTGDKIKYTTQAGNNIGGLENDKEYYVVVDPNNSNLIRLANSRTDAFAIDQALKTPDISDDGIITSKTLDLSSIGSLGSKNFAANSAVDGDKDTITFNTTNQFKIGQPVVYKKDTGNVIPGLNDRQVYYVITYSNTDSQQTIQLAETATLARQGIVIDIGSATGNHSLSPLHQFTAKVTDIDTDSIDLAKVFDITDPTVTPHALATGDQVNYTNRRGISIGGVGFKVLAGGETGLVDGEDYYIVTDPNNPNIIRLASSELKALEAYSKLEDDANADLGNLVIDFIANGGDVAAVNSKTFDPTEIGIVDDTENTIILDNAAFLEGSDPFGTDADFNIFGSTFEIGQAIVYSSGGGKPIGGLEDGKTYYVVTATDENNLDGDNRFFVGKQIIQLADTENKARAGIFLDIDPSVATGTEHSFTATHVIDSGLVAGVGVLANLSSSDTSAAESEMNDGNEAGEPDFSLDLIEKAGGTVSGVAKKIFDKLVNGSKNGNYKKKSDAGGNNPEQSSGKSPLAVAGALGFAYVNNDVIAKVGSNAILKSAEDLEVVGTIEHEVKLNADSDVANIAKNSGSAAVVVGIYTNNADAIVNSNAQLDAYKASRVIAEVKYPYLTRPDEYIPANLGELVDLVKSDGYGAVNDYLDGTLGLKSKLLNTWARSTASADNIGVSGSVNLLIFNNDVNAIIKEDAKINQDLAWRENSEDQSLSVEATNYMQMLNLTGVFKFDLGSLELDFLKGEASKPDVKLLGSDGKTGIGGAFFLMFLDNNTNAIVEDGVSIYSGAAGGFNMKAEEAIMNFNFTQAGSKAESYGIGGSFAYVNQNSNTLAQLSGGTRVEGRSANIYAGTLESHINWAGGVAVGQNLGFGITVAINDIDRSTDAIVGNYDPSIENQAIPLENTYISVTDGVTVNAVSDGWLGAFSVAAAAATESTPKDDEDDEVDGKSLNILFGDEPAEPSSKLGFSGDVSYNQVDDKVRAIVWDAGLLEASTIALSALNETDLYSVAGAVAFAKGGQNKTSYGLAGAASWNEILGEAKAYIKGQGANKQLKLNADQLTLDAEHKGEIFAITAGGSGAFANGAGNNVSLAGSFSYNEVDNTTESYLDGVNTTLSNSAKSVLNITPQSAIANNTINLDKSHGWLTGEKVIYDNGGDSQNITGLVSGKAYYVITDNDNPNSFKLASTEANAKNNIALSINGAGITGTSHSFTANNPLPIGFESDQIELDETKENTISLSSNDWTDGTAVIYDNGGGKSIDGLTHDNTYYVVTDSRDNKVIKLATNANGTGIVELDPSVAEGEGHRFYEASTLSSTQIIDFGEEHNWYNSDLVTYRNENGTAIGGLEDGEQYYVIVVNSTKIKLAKTPGGDAMDLNFRTATGDKHSLQRSVIGNSNYELFTFDPVKDNAFNLSQVEVKENFALDNPHDFTTGQAVVYDNDGGTSIGGLTNGETYYVIVDEDPNTFRLANSEIEAKLGFAIGLDPTTMTGDNHQFFPNSSVISAKDKSKIFAVAGTAILSLGGKKGGGFGFGFAWNDIDNTTKALVKNSTLSHDDSLQVIASNNSDIQTISASIGISQAQKFALTIAGTASVNFIDNVTEAAIINTNNGTIDDTSGLLRVKALDEADIKSLSGAVSVAISGTTSLGFGLAVAYNKIGTQSGHSTKAYISGSSIYVEDLDITANSNQLIQSISAAAAAAKSGKAAITAAGSVSINTIGDTQTAAYISGSPNIVVDQGINIKAKNEAKIQSFAGQVAVSFGSKGGGAIGGAIAVNRIDKTSDSNNEIGVYAYIDSSKVTSNSDRFDINIKAVSTSKIETISAGVQIGGGAKFGGVLGGSISINNIISTVSSYIANNADVTATKQNINLKTDDTTNIRAIAGQAAIAGGKGAAALGLAWADNDVENKIKSYIDKSKVATSSGSIDVNANSTAKIETLSAGAQIAGGKGSGALGGSQSSNTITNTISSYISNGAEVTANQNLDIKAKDESTIRSIAGQVAIAGGKGAAGVGVAWATNRVKNQVNSYINQKSQVTTNIGSININANSNADIQTISAGIQVAGGALAGAAGGSVSSNIVENKIKSYIDKDADVTVNQNLDIKAKDTSNIIAIAGQAAIAGGKAAGAVGVVWADNDIKNLVESYIDFSKVRTNIGSINLNANSISTIETLSAGAQIAGGAVGIAAGGSTSINTVENTVSSYIKNNSNVTAEQKINLKTNDNSTIRALAGQVAIAVGKGSGTIGVALAENDIENNINSYIESSTVKANNDSIDINAVSTAKIETLSAVASGSGGKFSGSVAVPISHNQIKNSISAHIKNSANISAKQDIKVKATDDSTIKSLSGGAAIALSIGGGVGVAFSYNNIENDTQAYTSNSTLKSSAGSILVSADSKGTIQTIAAAMGGSGIAGVAGSVAINEMDNETYAYVSGGSLTADGSIGIFSQSRNQVKIWGGAVGIGGAGGVGGTVAVNNIDNITKAYVTNNANLTAKGQVSLELPKEKSSDSSANISGVGIVAVNNEDVEVKVGTVSVGGIGLSGTVVVNSIENKTQAYVSSGTINNDLTEANGDQSVLVKAFSDASLNVLAGGLAIGGTNGIGVSLDISSIKNTTTAYIGDQTTVKAQKDITVKAIGNKTVESNVVAGGGGGLAGLAGAISVINIGSAMSDKGSEAAGDGSQVITDQINEINQYSSKINIDTSIISEFAKNAVVDHATQAYIGTNANLEAGGDITVKADETTKLHTIAGAVGIGLKLGAGGAVGVVNINHNTQAFVGAGATLSARGDINVEATGNIGSNKDVDPNKLILSGEMVETYAGTAGKVGLGAAVSYLDVNNNVRAYIASNSNNQTQITQARNVNVLATANSNLSVKGAGASIGAAAVGVVIGRVSEGGTVKAYLGDSIQIGQGSDRVESLSVKAIGNGSATAKTQSAAAGLLGAGNGSDARVTINPNVTAYIGNNAEITVSNDVEVNATFTPYADAQADGVSVAAGLKIGISIARTDVSPIINSYIGSNSDIVTGQVLQGNPSLTFSNNDAIVTPNIVFNATSSTISRESGSWLEDGFVVGSRVKIDGSELNDGTFSITGISGDGRTLTVAAPYQSIKTENPATYGNNTDSYIQDSVTFKAIGNAAITRQSGGWKADGFEVGQTIRVVNSAGNNGLYTIAGISADDKVITLSNGDNLAQENNSSNVVVSITGGASITGQPELTFSDTSNLTVSRSFNFKNNGSSGSGDQIIRDENSGSWLDDGFAAGQKLTISNTNDVNDQVVTIASISADGKTLTIEEKDVFNLSIAGDEAAMLGTITSDKTIPKNTITRASGSWLDDGFLRGQTIQVEDSTKNNNTYAIADISPDGKILTLTDAVRLTSETTNLANIALPGSRSGNLSVIAAQASTNDKLSGNAEAFGAGGGLLVGLNATTSKAYNNGQVTSYIGDQSSLVVAGTAKINAGSNISQKAEVDGYNGGLLAAGFNQAEANTGEIKTQAYLGQGININGTAFSLYAGSTTNNFADATSGSGGLISGAAAQANTTDNSVTTVNTNYTASGTPAANNIKVGTLDINAVHTAEFNGKVNTINASLVGGSGSRANHDIDAEVKAEVGKNTNITTENLVINSTNRVRKEWLNGNEYNITSGSGGLIDLPAVKSETNIDHDTKVVISDGTSIKLIGDKRDPGQFLIGAVNDIYAKDKVKLDSGGAIPIAKAESIIKYSSNTDEGDNSIQIGDADLTSIGDINLSAYTSADIDTNSNVKTYGLASAGTGTTRTEVNTNHNIRLNNGSHLVSGGKVNILAGRYSSNPSFSFANRYDLDALTDIYNKTAFAVSDVTADAILTQNNSIVVGSGALVESVGDVNLLTEKGFSNLTAKGKAKTAGIDLSEFSQEVNESGRERNETSSVTVDGTIKVGIQNQQYLTIEKDGKVSRQSDGVTIKTSKEDLAGNIISQIENLRGLKIAYAGSQDTVDAFDAEIRRLQNQMADLGLASYQDGGKTLVIGQNTLAVDYITVDDILAQSSNINVVGDSFSGSGNLEAPGDTEIEIINKSAAFLRLNKLIIPETEGGKISFNYEDLASNPGSFNSFTTAGSSTEPSITVKNTYNPIGDEIEPNIEITADVENVRGSVTLTNETGSIITTGNIVGKTLTISSGKDVVVSVPLDQDDYYLHIGGHPKSGVWSGYTSRLESQTFANDAYIADDKAYLGYPNFGFPFGPKQQKDIEVPQTSVTPSSTVAGNNVYISAPHINVNGLVQSGLADQTITLTNSIQSQINAFAWQYSVNLDSGLNPERYYKLEGTSGNIAAYYDAQEKRIEIDKIRVQGGYMELLGEITSTGNGKLKVLDGYGRININNQTNYDLSFRGLDVGRGVEGQIRITDLAKRVRNGSVFDVDVNVNPTTYADTRAYSTLYKRIGKDITVYDSLTRDSNGTPNNLIRTTAGRTEKYNPAENFRFTWVTGLEKLQRDITTYRTKSWAPFGVFEIDALAKDPGNIHESRTIPVGSPVPLIEGEYMSIIDPASFIKDGKYRTQGEDANKYDPYSYGFQRITTAERKQVGDIETWETSSGWGPWKTKTYYAKVTYEKGFKNINIHSLNADAPINIEFAGYDTPDITIKSIQDILFAGVINGRLGSVNVTSSAGSIQSLSDEADVNGNAITLRAATGISVDINSEHKNPDNPDGFLSATTNTGDIFINSGQGDLRVKRVTTNNGDVRVNALQNISAFNGTNLIKGDRINLISTNGEIGNDTQGINLDSGTKGVIAKANGSINLTETVGDIYLDSVISTTGNVKVKANSGDFVDANNIEEEDTRTIEELQNLWDALYLTGDAAIEQAKATTVKAYKQAKEQDYQTYWNYRSDASGGFNAYDAGYTFKFDTETRNYYESDLSFTSDKIDELESKKTNEYKQLHAFFNARGEADTYNANYSYTVTTEEENELIKGAQWSESQLKYSISPGLLRPIADTQTTIEDPNVTAKGDINLIATTGGFGVISDVPITLDFSSLTGGGVQVTDGDINLNNLPSNVLNDEQKVALIAAERDDLTFVLTNGTDKAVQALADGDIVKYIRIDQREDIDVQADGVINITAAKHLFLGSEVDININQIQTSEQATIKGAKNIINLAASGVTNIASGNLILEASDDSIGTVDKSLHIDLNDGATLTVRAKENIYITEDNGNINLDSAFSNNHITLEADDSILDAFGTDNSNVEQDSVDIVTNTLILQTGGGVGTETDPLETVVNKLEAEVGTALTGQAIGTKGLWLYNNKDLTIGGISDKVGITGNGSVSVKTPGKVEITENISVAGDIKLESVDGEGDTQTVIIPENAVIESLSGNIDLLIGDNFLLPDNSIIRAETGKVTISSDHNNTDIGSGATVDIYGWIYANLLEIYGNNDDDIFNIRRLAAKTNLYARGGLDIINVGSNAPSTGGTLNEIKASLTVHGEDNADGKGDILNVYDTGDNTDNSGTLTDKSITGLGMGGSLFYNTIEELNINLGSGNDNFITLNNGTITNLNTGAGNDKVRVGPTLDEDDVPQDETLDGVVTPGSEIFGTSHKMTVYAGAGEDVFEVNRNSAELKLYGEADNDTVTINTAINGRRHLNNAVVDVIGGEGINQAFINGSEIADEMIVRGDSVEIVDSHLINLAKIAFLDIKGKKGKDIFHIDTNIDSSGDILTTSDIQNLEVDGGDSDDTINLYGMRSTTDIKLYGGSQDDTFNIGSESPTTVNKISGAVEIFGDRPNTRRTNQDSDTLNINDNQDTAKNTGVLTDDEITGLGLGKEGIVYKGLETVNLNLGTGNDNFTVKSTHTGATNINANDGKDKIEIITISGDTTVKAGDGSDTVNVGSRNPGTGGTVDGIRASLIVHGEGDKRDKDVLNVDDSGDSDNNSGVLTENSLTGLDMKVGISYNTVEYLNLALGSGSDDFVILDNAAVTTIDAGNGDNSFRIGAVLDDNGTPQSETVNGELKPGEEIAGISQEMTINAGSGNNFFQVNRNIADLNLNGSTGADTFEVNISTASGSNNLVNINAGTGADVAKFNGSSSSEQFEINSSSVEVVNKRSTNLTSVETLKVNGQGGSEAFKIDTTVDKDGTSAKTSDITNIEVNGNSGNDQFELQGMLSTISTTLHGNEGSDTFNVGNTSNKVDSILGAVSIFGDGSTDTLNFNNQGDTRNNRGSLSSNAITGLGLSTSMNLGSLETTQINLGFGNDTFTIKGTNTGKTVVNTNDGKDKVDIESVSGQTTVNTGDDEDVITVDSFNSSGSAVLEINSFDGDDYIDASAAIIGMTINGNDGNDTILGGAGNDTIGGGADDDRIDAGAGDDFIDGDSNFINNRFRTASNRNQGDDTIWGGAGEDEINGRGGNDYLIGGSSIADTPNGKDTIITGRGNDFEAEGNATIDPLTGAIVQINDDSQTNNDSSTGQQQQNGNTGTTQPTQTIPAPATGITPISIAPINVSIPSISIPSIGTISNNQATQNNSTTQETPTTQPTQNTTTTQNTPVTRITPIRFTPINISIPSIRPIGTVNNQPSPNTTTTQDSQTTQNNPTTQETTTEQSTQNTPTTQGTPTTQPTQNTTTTQNTPVTRITPIRITPINISIPPIRPIGTVNNQPIQNNPTTQETTTEQPTQNNPTTQETTTEQSTQNTPTTQETPITQPIQNTTTTQNTPVTRITPIRITPINISIPPIRPIRTVFNNQPSPTTTQDNQTNENSTNN